MRRSQLEKHHEKIAVDITAAENAAGIESLNVEYPRTSEIEAIRKAYFEHKDIETRKKLIALRIALSKAFISNAQLNLDDARKELNKAKFKGPKNRLYAAVAAIILCSPIYENYGVAGTLTALFVLYMIASYYDHASRVEQEEALTEARAYFDECRDRLIETKKETEYFADGEQYDGAPSKFYKFFDKAND
jgi:hypothetical protein